MHDKTQLDAKLLRHVTGMRLAREIYHQVFPSQGFTSEHDRVLRAYAAHVLEMKLVPAELYDVVNPTAKQATDAWELCRPYAKSHLKKNLSNVTARIGVEPRNVAVLDEVATEPTCAPPSSRKITLSKGTETPAVSEPVEKKAAKVVDTPAVTLIAHRLNQDLSERLAPMRLMPDLVPVARAEAIDRLLKSPDVTKTPYTEVLAQCAKLFRDALLRRFVAKELAESVLSPEVVK
ncbi:hypothetical protein UFOVP777_28 [uncultured Caudovirales phage]|uniref:Uncharacterized protein n=1 Tax=uncultured Caudovirales phage TaxID=2100421 RepID=A0A6J5NR27_9CAUD|nr:hypothetical protein UFOVP777_28 [uncultured Caudovirales phage]